MIIEVNNVSKKFKDDLILKNVNIEFKTGKIYGLVGVNGSGKSVLLKLICAFYKPSSGEILINGKNYHKSKDFPNEIRAFIEKPCFLSNLTGFENLKLLANIQKKISDKDILMTLQLVNLEKEKDKHFSKYSLGMKQKLGIASVLMENPKIMIFDEPFNGVDEKTRNILFEKLKKIKKDKIIIISSHIKEEIENLCDIVYFFDEGNVNEMKKR